MNNVTTDDLFPSQLLYSMVFYFILTDVNGKYIGVNALARESFPYILADMQEAVFINTLHEEDIPAYYQAINTSLQFPFNSLSVELRRKPEPGDTEPHWIRWEVSVSGDKDKRIISHIGHDIHPAETVVKPADRSANLDITKLKALVNHIPGAIYRCRSDEFLSLEFFSNEIEKLTGYPMDYFMDNRKDGYLKIIYKDDVSRLKTAIHHAIAEKEKFEIEYRIIKKDGEIRWVFENAQAVYDDEDKVSYIDGCIFDITRRKQTEMALARSEDEVRRLALVAHNTTNSVLITDAEGIITWVNEGYARISGYTPEEVRGKRIGYSLIGPGYDEESQQLIQSALDNRLPFKEEFISYTKTGNPIWLEVDCHPLQDENGIHLGFMAIESDITQRKTALKEQEELVRRLTLATDSASIGIFEIDLGNNHVIWDDRMYELYGYPKDTPVSLYKIFDKAVHPEDAQMMSQIIGELLSRKKEINGAVYRIVLPDGGIRYIESHAIIKKSESGRVLSLIGTNRDVTDDILVQEKIKSQNKVLREIAFIQSHEVRKPLANILGVIEILKHSGAMNGLEIFDHLVESAQELDQQIRAIVNKTNNIDDDVFR
jgi:PAS domain S-box-containing protein